MWRKVRDKHVCTYAHKKRLNERRLMAQIERACALHAEKRFFDPILQLERTYKADQNNSSFM
jgi:hypothetical protein